MTLKSNLRSQSMLARMVAQHQGRPVLMTPDALHVVAEQLRLIGAQDEAPRRFGLAAIARMFKPEPAAMDDDDLRPAMSAGDLFDYQGAMLRPSLVGINPARITVEGWGFVIVDDVAIIQMHGAIPEAGGEYCGDFWHGYDTIAEAVRQASADARAKAILLWQKSPGGVVCGGLDVAANAITNAGKPVHVFADQSCSAAYWLASGATQIHASRYAMIGSIGAVILHEDISGALERAGVVISSITFGSEKVAGNWWTALSDATRATLQAEIDQIGRDFVAKVCAGRPALSPETVIATQAGVFLGAHDEAARSALAIGLIDTIQTDVIAALDVVVSSLAAPVPMSEPVAPPPNVAPPAGSATVPQSPALSTPKEATMAKRNPQIAAIMAEAEASSDDKLARIQAIMDEEEEASAESEDVPVEDEEEDDAAPEASVDAKTAKAIIALPEAKGREALANHLAFEPGMTVVKAKATLALATKATALNPLNPQIGVGDAPSKSPSADKSVDLFKSAMAKLGHKVRA
jgi:capsid assembly protease